MIACFKVWLATVVLLFSCPLLASNHQYAIIVDAGSSGSRLHVFQYEPATNNTPLPMIKDVFSKNITPGLSSYAKHPDAAGASLKPILDAAARYLEQNEIPLSDVPVHVYATAGMRLLSSSDQEAIYKSVRQYIHTQYTFSLVDHHVRTITGQQEGLFGWLDVNYLSNSFTHSTSTLGSIDMGGASTQIAFATTAVTQPENIIEVTINHTPYRIFTQSFLGLGQDQARRAMTADDSSTNCYPTSYLYGSKLGNFDFTSCSNIYNRIIQDNKVAPQMISTAGQHFIAYSGVFYNYSFFNLLKNPTQSALQSQINAICYLPWETLNTKKPEETQSYLSNYCANAVYFDSLLYNTYQLQDAQLQVTDKIEGTDIDWTLGALLFDLVA